jgi:hypothetical protein
VSISNVWRTRPVFDSLKWVELVNASGLTVLPNRNISFPELNDPPFLLDYEEEKHLGLLIVPLFALALGIPFDKFSGIFSDEIFNRGFPSPPA